jgi:hypothetical protein
VDWSREYFTMDATQSAVVNETFVRLYEEGLIYRGKRLVSWDPVLKSAVSDLEVESAEEDGFLWHIRYPLADADGRPAVGDGSGSIVVATDVNPLATILSSGTTSLPTGNFGPVLTAAVGATVDNAFDVTFTEDSAWRAAITGVKVGTTAGNATAIAAAAFTAASAGKVTFDPSQATQLQTSGSKVLVISATGYADVTVTQSLGVGVASKLGMGTQPVGPTTNGGVLATQPVVRIQDKYGNTVTTSTASVTAAVESGTGSWTLGGTLVRNAAAGVATFSGLTATGSGGSISGARIRFTSGTLTLVVSNAFAIPASA